MLDLRYVFFSANLLDVAAQPATRLAEGIKAMRQSRGWSHDQLVAELRSRGLTGASRAGVIEWEKKRVPREPAKSVLVSLGVDARLWPSQPGEELSRLRAEVAALHRDLEWMAEQTGLRLPEDDENDRPNRKGSARP